MRDRLLKEVHADPVILDGELVVTDHLGRSNFAALIVCRNQVRFFAFDLLHLNGEDLRGVPLVKRKETLKRILPSRSPHVLYLDHTRGSGTELYCLCCQLDLEEIVAKRAESLYEDNKRAPHWIKRPARCQCLLRPSTDCPER